MNKWIEGRYNSISLQLAKGIEIYVVWDSTKSKDEPTGYKVSFLGDSLKARFGDRDEAKRAGEFWAKNMLEAALANIPTGVAGE